MNYLCFVDGLLEYASSDPASFAHYQLVYAEEHKNADVQYKVSQFADELEAEIGNNGRARQEDRTYGEEWYPNHEPEVIEYLKEQLPKMRKMSEIMRHIDYLYSGDHGDDYFLKYVKEVEAKYDF